MSSTHTLPLPRGARAGRCPGLVAIMATVTAAIVLGGFADRPAAPTRTAAGMAVALLSVDPIDIAQGISITPAPGWTLGDRGPDWVALYNADSSAQLEVWVRPANGTDAVANLQREIDRLTRTPSAHLTNVKTLTAPTTKTLQSDKFQQKAYVNYTADVSTPQQAVPVIGTFSELVNTSNRLSAFIAFRQSGNATGQAAGDGGTMIDSML